ncbi:hypothetical protein [Thermoproteus tenax]|uniref:Uncharacterized protein n=1 Tax=Thermoproteus tenax (strain ATCC 35583 / DSM 2078 / JCM 9277 / NBRC 100435 / Kra 1) TaxID=768679 RepID=G4RPG4_THETK|nr:hypothetical protein [Thermoproteus tenax]CCC81459.1 conserved hypothetical protein [Thermoproteus tenax Kra 1]
MIVIDRGSEIRLVEDVEVVVSPLCRGQPPPLKLDRPAMEFFDEVVHDIYGERILPHLIDQKILGLDEMDPRLLLAQLPLKSSYIAFLLPYVGRAGRCINAYPTAVLASLAVLSRGVRSLAVDVRWDDRGIAKVSQMAMQIGAKLQLIAVRPLDLPGEIFVTEKVPFYLRRRIVGLARGDVDGAGRQFAPLIVRLQEEGTWEPVDYGLVLDKIAEVLGLRESVFNELVELGHVAYRSVVDLGVRPWQLSYLLKWDLLEPIAGGFRVGRKLLYLISLSERR